jgi:hypothetical protein
MHTYPFLQEIIKFNIKPFVNQKVSGSVATSDVPGENAVIDTKVAHSEIGAIQGQGCIRPRGSKATKKIVALEEENRKWRVAKMKDRRKSLRYSAQNSQAFAQHASSMQKLAASAELDTQQNLIATLLACGMTEEAKKLASTMLAKTNPIPQNVEVLESSDSDESVTYDTSVIDQILEEGDNNFQDALDKEEAGDTLDEDDGKMRSV